MRKLVEVRDLLFRYDGGFELSVDSLDAEEGEVVALLGPNGSGKTTLLLCIAGILRPARGIVRVAGREISKLSRREIAELIGLVPQEHHPTFPYAVLDFVVMGRAAYVGLFASPGEGDYKAAERALEAVGMSHLANRPYTQVSGGERRLVLVARALAQEPRLLLLDEPTAYLDFKNQIKVLSVVKKLVEREGLAALVTLHDPTLAASFSNRVVLMDSGRVVASGPPEEVVTADRLEEVYGVPVRIVRIGGASAIVPVMEEVVGA